MRQQIAQRLGEVMENVTRAAERSGRRAEDVELLAVTKTLSAETVFEGYMAGLRMFGENKFQEAPAKVERLDELIQAAVERGELEEREPAQWHFIGGLQSNKVRKVVETFSVIHSLDRKKLLRKCDETAADLGITAQGLIQVNVAGTESQGGVAPEELEDLIEYAAEHANLHLRGLMAIGPITDDESRLRAAFRRVRRLAEDIEARQIPGISMKTLSMGMTSDYPVAIEEGATMIRLGTALFGPRNYQEGAG